MHKKFTFLQKKFTYFISKLKKGLLSANQANQCKLKAKFTSLCPPMRELPYNQIFRNGRGNVLYDVYLEFFLYVFHAFFYTALTGRRIEVKCDQRTRDCIFVVPYLKSVDAGNIITGVVNIKINNRDVDGPDEHWLLTILDTRDGPYPNETYNMQDIGHPVFDTETGELISRAQAERLAYAQELEANIRATNAVLESRRAAITQPAPQIELAPEQPPA